MKGKPKFRDVAAEFVEFARGAEWIIHNAPFDVAFLDAELDAVRAAALRRRCTRGVIDTLALAREMFPGKRNNLDALCERFGVDNAQRTLHGALLDAQLLAEVYLAMTRGQETLTIDMPMPSCRWRAVRRSRQRRRRHAALRDPLHHPDAAELAAHPVTSKRSRANRKPAACGSRSSRKRSRRTSPRSRCRPDRDAADSLAALRCRGRRARRAAAAERAGTRRSVADGPLACATFACG